MVFKVYGITASNDGGGGLVFWFQQGPIGLFQQAVSPIRPDVAVPYGQIFFQQTTVPLGHSSPFLPPTIVGVVGSAGFDSTTLCSPFPLFILPAGYSLVGANVGSYGNAGASFWYQLAKE